MSAKIIIAGDFCPKDRVVDVFEREDYAFVLMDVKSQITQADYAIVNFECPVCVGGETPIQKCGPNLQCTEKGVMAVKWAGFDCVTLANNHFLDYGEAGAKNTLNACDKLNLDHVGGGINLCEASKILYKNINGHTVAIINCCEHEFSIATEYTSGSSPLSLINQYYQIKEAKGNADFVILIVHGGVEFYNLPTPQMQQTYRFFIDSGADAVINHHQHCLSGFEVYKQKPIFYGLGNFCFDRKGKRNNDWNEGYMVDLTLEKGENISFDIIPYLQCNDEPRINIVDKDYIYKKIEVLNSIISSSEVLEKKYVSFINNNKEEYLLALEPYINHWGGLRKRGFLPSLLSKKYFLRLYGYIICESHVDRLKEILKREIYG